MPPFPTFLTLLLITFFRPCTAQYRSHSKGLSDGSGTFHNSFYFLFTGMTLEQFKRAIKLSGTGRSQRSKEQIRQQVQSEKPPIGRNSTSAASGQYGYGLFAGFAVAEEITITTKSEGGRRLTCHLKK